MPLFQTKPAFDVAIDGRPVEHGEPVAEPDAQLDRVEPHGSRRGSVERFKDASMTITSMGVQVDGQEQVFGDLELQVVREVLADLRRGACLRARVCTRHPIPRLESMGWAKKACSETLDHPCRLRWYSSSAQ